MAGLYIHIPFCAKRCLYCDFYSNTDMHHKQRYINAVLKEALLRRDELRQAPVHTIYLGGGTPSQLSAEDLQRLFDGLNKLFDLSVAKEITLEANPDDMTPEYVKSLRNLPINRISMGVQSFNADELKFLNRRHTPEQAREAVANCKANGFDNISIDLIYGLPGQTPEAWKSHLSEALKLNIPHLSAYHLIYEPGTALYRMLEAGKVSSVDEETSVKLFEILIDTLKKAGYEQYEISNFALPGQYSQHNSSYWKGTPYLGLGASAHSFDGESRRWNVASIQKYMEGYENKTPEIEIEILDSDTRYNDYIITGLRTQWGIDLTEIASLFGSDRADYCSQLAIPYLKKGLLKQENNIVSLTEAGVFLSDGIMSDLLFVKE